MDKRKKWVLVTILVLVGGYVIARVVYALLLTLGLVSGPRAHAKAKLDLGPYPLEIESLGPQDVDLSWYDPAKAVQRVQDANAKPRLIKEKALKEQRGDAVKAVEALLQKIKEPDAAEALFQLMAELAPVVPSTAVGETTPAGLVSDQIGIRAVAKAAELLQTRYGTKEMGHFDSPLMERAILLMAHYGAPDLPGVKKIPLSNGNKEVPPIDPVVRTTLRALLKAGDLPQVLAAKALGQLGDPGTAQEIIQNPKMYPGASIADFGPGAVEVFKQKRLKDLTYGVEGFDNFVQGMRLTPKYQDTAIDLAIAGDSGAGMAMQRNFMVGIWNSGDKDGLMASYFDRALRFHGTRTGFTGEQGANRWDMVVEFGPRWRKSNEMMLRILDHDLKLVFTTNGWRHKDLVGVLGFGLLTSMWHEHKLRCHIGPGKLDPEAFDGFYESMEKLFRKYYRKTIHPDFSHPNSGPDAGNGSLISGELVLINRYARHLGLDAVEAPGRPVVLIHEVGYQPDTHPDENIYAEEKKWNWIYHGGEDWRCIKLGHLTKGERL